VTRKSLLFAGFVAACLSLAVAGFSAAPAPGQLKTASYGRLPLSFEANQGQVDSQVRFLARGNGYAVFLTDSGAMLRLGTHTAAKDDLVLRLAGARTAGAVTGEEKLAGTANYFRGSDPQRWRTGVETFARVRYAAVYPGIDLAYYGNQRELEDDFVVAPGADASLIRLAFAGGRLRLDSEGNLTVRARSSSVVFHKPFLYQEAEGQRRRVQGSFVLLDHSTVGFRVGSYDRARPLVIDPVLTYGTYLGGSGYDEANAIAVDGSGNAYITGETSSSDFPVTTGAAQGSRVASWDVFVAKLNPAGTALVYATYLGGSAGDYGSAIAVDSHGNAYVTGTTFSTDFPTTAGALLTKSPTSGSTGNAFVSKISADGTSLAYSTYLGGTGTRNGDGGYAIAVDAAGDAFVAGGTDSTDFPVTLGAYQTKNIASYGHSNAFITVLNPTGAGLVYSTYLGGSYGEAGFGIAADSTGSAYVTGQTQSSDFPVSQGAYQASNNGASAGNPNVFVTKLNPTGSALAYSTYLGGTGTKNGGDQGYRIAIDGSGDAYVTGVAFSKDFPTTNGAFQTANRNTTNHSNAFVTAVNPTGTGLVYSTYLGGSGSLQYGDNGSGIAVDSTGNAYVAGTAYSTDFPVTSGAYQTVNRGANFQNQTAFVTKVNPAGTALVYSTYLGGSGSDNGNGIAIDSSGNAYVDGTTYSNNFPVTTGSLQSGLKGVRDAFIAMLALGGQSATTPTTTTVSASANPAVVNQNVTFTAKVKAGAGTDTPTGTVTFSYPGWNGTVSSAPEPLDASGNATVVWSWSAITDGGIVITAAYSGGAEFLSSSGTITETINLEPQTISFTPPGTVTAAAAPINLASYASASSGLPVSFGLVSGPATLNGTTLTITGVGSVVVQATQGGNGSWAAATPVNATIQVTQGQQTVTFNPPASIAFMPTAIDLSAYGSATSGLPVAFKVMSGPGKLSGTLLTLTGLGSVVINANQAGNATWAAASTVSATIKVTQAQQTISFAPPASVSFGSAALNLASYASASSGLTVSFSLVSGPATLKGASLTLTGAGKVVVQAAQTGNANYAAAAAVKATINVLPEAQTLTFTPPATVNFGSAPMNLTSYAKASSGLAPTFSLVSGPATLKGATLTITGAGSVVVQAAQAGNANWAAATPVNATIAVQPEAQTVTFTQPPQEKYGAAPVNLATYAKASSGLTVAFTVLSGPATMKGAVVTFTGAGAVVVQAAQTGNSNWAAATPVNKTITVQAVPLTVTLSNATMVYGAAVPTLTGYKLSGFVNGDTSAVVQGAPAITTTATSASNAGTYPITGTAGTLAAANYTFTFVPGVLTVQKAALTVTANNLTMQPGAKVPTLTCTMAGFVNGDKQSTATKGAPTLTTTATSSSKVGSYPITVKIGTLTATNYSFTLVNGTLTVANPSSARQRQVRR